MAIPPAQVRFKDNLSSFFQHVQKVMNETKIGEIQTIQAMMNLIECYDIEMIIAMFAMNTHEHWPLVKQRDEIFFTKMDETLSKFPIKGGNKQILTTIMSQKKNNEFVLSIKDRTIFWDFFDSFIYIMIDFIHSRRVPKKRIDASGNPQPMYGCKFLPQINLNLHSKQWAIDLPFH